MHADDMDLVREFAASGSEAAFATLVRRHVNLVYSAALRRLGNAPEAEEVAQNVFIILARKARSLRRGTILSGWLYQTAQLTAANFQRAAIRRQHREQEAFMQFSEQSEPNASWHRLSPLLEEAMARLSQKERDAIVLRFFENRTVREVADALDLREDAAQKRVNRATDKLRDYFVRRGIQVSTAALLVSLGTHAVQAAPAELASKIVATAALKGAVGSSSTLTLIKGALKIMAWTKAKTAVVVGAGLLLAVGTTTLTVKTIHAIRAASPPDIQGAWEGTAEILGTQGVLQGEKARSRVVFQFFKTNGTYTATGVFIDTAPDPFRVTKFTYDYPSVRFAVGQDFVFEGKLRAGAKEIAATQRRGNLSATMLLKRTVSPDATPEPLAKSEYTPRTGSDLQGTWKSAIGSGRYEVRLAIRIAETSPGTFRAELDNLTSPWLGQPMTVTYNPPEVKLEVASGAGMFQGEVRKGNTELAGNWIQGGGQTPVVFNRADR